MENQFKIIIATAAICLGTFLLAVFWPKITTRKPPEPIKKLREEVKGTKVGKDLLNVLGESAPEENKSNEKTVVDRLLETTGDIITNTANSTTEKVKEEITKILIEKSSEKIIDQLNQLPQKEKEEIKKEWCK